MNASNLSDEIPKECAQMKKATPRSLERSSAMHKRLFRNEPSLTDAIESREGEELVRIEDHGAYTLVIAERANKTGTDRGPFAYRVQWETETGNEGGQYNWHYLRRVYDEP